LIHPEDVVRSRGRRLHRGIGYRQSPIDRVDVERNQVHLADRTTLGYDGLVVPTGVVLVPRRPRASTGPGVDGAGVRLLPT
jgi:sulfide:quinone oxidoreductase